MDYKLRFWMVNAVTAFLRLLFIGKVGLTVDEAHYWVYTKFLDLSYFDHPPLIAYIIKLSTLIFGNTEFAVRFPAVIIFFTASWIFFICASKLYNEKTAFVGALLLNVLPVFSFLGSVVSIPDSPLALFWIISLLVFLLIIETNGKKYWYLLGVIVGFALLSKYNAIMIPIGITLFLILSPKHRFWFKEKEPYLAFFIMAAIFIPVILWNIENNWASFGFQMRHGFGNSMPKFSLLLFLRSLGAQSGYLSPTIFLVFFAAAFLCVKEAWKKKDRTALIIACFSLPTLILFNFIATFNEVLPHWPAMGYLVLTIYVAHITLEYWKVKWFKIYTIIAWAFTIIFLIIASLHLIYKIIPIEKFMPEQQAQKIKYGIPEAERVDISNDLFGWKEVGEEIKKITNSYPDKNKPFIFTHKSYLASQIAFAAPDIRIYCLSDKIDAYDLWQRSLKKLADRDAIFICNDFFYFDPQKYGSAFDTYSQPREFSIYRNGKKIKNFFFTECKKFKPLRLEEKYTANILRDKKNISDGLIKADHEVFKFINSIMHVKILDFYMSVISFCDSKNFNLGVISILIISIAIMWTSDKKHFWTDIMLMTSVLVTSALIVYFMKAYFERPRPLSVFGDENVNVFYETVHKNSFPSGHTNTVFAVCTVMYMLVKKYWYWYIIFAFGMGFERIYVGSHFPSDVLTGAAIGAMIAYVMVRLFKKYTKN
ncbi:MAG: glycosyltransferase family 39 protein [Endomicrobium sp.]|jgi:membrane-associated phospholipid phosphatase|nr:glycosyltransferase family 39 protein [Endomicrobium sp.]